MKAGRIHIDGTMKYFRFDEQGVRRIVLTGRKKYAPWDPQFKDLPLGDEVPKDAVLAPPVPVSEIVCVGLNYRLHADECGVDWTKFSYPTFFGRATTSLNNPNGHVVVPGPYVFRDKPLEGGLVQWDYEVELALVIGRACYKVSVGDALQYVAGYMVANDLSERIRQLKACSQWLSGKCLPTGFPLGPNFVSSDEVGDPQKLNLRLWVNGEERQNSTTADMIFSVAECISALSQTRVLQPGLVISTGTPSGVVTKMDPAKIVHPWLKPGDKMELTIGNDTVDLGRQTQLCVEEDPGWLKFFATGRLNRGKQYHSPAA